MGSGGLSWMAMAALLAVAVGGVVLLIVGWRGRRVDDHPLCRRCGFDLTGKPADSTRCSECGADLQRAKAVRIGHRARWPALIIAGLLLALLSTTFIAISAYSRIQQIDWIRYRPVSWLLSDADNAAAGNPNDPALLELLRRIEAGELSDARVAQVVEHVLGVQADPQRTWHHGWSDLVVAAGTRGQLSDEQVAQFVMQGVRIELAARPKVRRDGRILRMFHWDRFRLGGAIRISGQLRGDLRASDVVIKEGFVRDSDSIDGYLVPGRVTSTTDAGPMAPLPNGKHELATDVEFELSITHPFTAGPFRFSKQATAAVELVDADALVEEFVVDEAHREAMQAAVPAAVVDIAEEGSSVEVLLKGPLSMPLAMEVILAAGGREQSVGQLHELAVGGGAGYWREVKSKEPPLFRDGVVDVILRPSQAASENSMTLGRYWGEPIVLKDVPIGRTAEDGFTMDETLRAAVEGALEPPALKWSGHASKPLYVRLGIRFRSPGPPVPVIFELYVRGGGREVKAGSGSFRPGQQRGFGYYSALPAEGLTTVDLVLRPRPDRGSRPAGQAPPWGYEIVFRDVPLPDRLD